MSESVKESRPQLRGNPLAPTLPSLMEFIGTKTSTTCQIKVVVGAFNAPDWRVTLEETPLVPSAFVQNGPYFEAELKDFVVKGPLDVLLEGRGSIGGAVAARITCNGKVLSPDLEVILKNLYGFDSKSYVV